MAVPERSYLDDRSAKGTKGGRNEGQRELSQLSHGPESQEPFPTV